MTLRDPIRDGVHCARCGELRDQSDVDRLLWCEACQVRVRHESARKGWMAGLVVAIALAAYIWGVLRPSDLVLGGWIATVVAGLWISGRIAREIFYAVERGRGAKGGSETAP